MDEVDVRKVVGLVDAGVGVAAVGVDDPDVRVAVDAEAVGEGEAVTGVDVAPLPQAKVVGCVSWAFSMLSALAVS